MPRRALSAVLALVSMLALALALPSCMGPTFVVQQYTGPQRDAWTVATLRVNGSDAVRLLTLDDQDLQAPLESDSRLHIEILPGRHSVAVLDAKNPRRRSLPVLFDAEAGKVYRVLAGGAPAAEAGGEGGLEAHVHEVDRSSDTPGRDVTVPLTRSGPLTR